MKGMDINMKRASALVVTVIMIFALCSCNVPLFVGDGWQATPEKALSVAADATIDTLNTLTPTTVLDTFYIDGMAFMLFVSKGESLVEAEFVTNGKGEYHYLDSIEEVSLDLPDTFVLNGNESQELFTGYFIHGNTAWGYKYSSADITVNGSAPSVKSYTFTAQGKEWRIDRWWIEGVTEESDIITEYVS